MPCTMIWLSNYFTEHNAIKYPIEKDKSKWEKIYSLRTFGCSVYVHPPENKKSKLKKNVSKGIFIGYDPHTPWNVL